MAYNILRTTKKAITLYFTRPLVVPVIFWDRTLHSFVRITYARGEEWVRNGKQLIAACKKRVQSDTCGRPRERAQ